VCRWESFDFVPKVLAELNVRSIFHKNCTASRQSLCWFGVHEQTLSTRCPEIRSPHWLVFAPLCPPGIADRCRSDAEVTTMNLKPSATPAHGGDFVTGADDHHGLRRTSRKTHSHKGLRRLQLADRQRWVCRVAAVADRDCGGNGGQVLSLVAQRRR